MNKELFIYLFITLTIIISCIISIKRNDDNVNNTEKEESIENNIIKKKKKNVLEESNIYEGTNIIRAEHVDTEEKYEVDISSGALVYIKPINHTNISHHVFKDVTEFSSVKRLRPNGIYRHFKKKYYKYIKVAYDVSSGRYLALYMSLYGDNKYWLRPIEDFLSEVDKDKHPEVTQKYRFELIRKTEIYEHEINYHLISASNYFLKLSNNTKFDIDDFSSSIRNCQRIAAMKALRRTISYYNIINKDTD